MGFILQHVIEHMNNKDHPGGLRMIFVTYRIKVIAQQRIPQHRQGHTVATFAHRTGSPHNHKGVWHRAVI